MPNVTEIMVTAGWGEMTATGTRRRTSHTGDGPTLKLTTDPRTVINLEEVRTDTTTDPLEKTVMLLISTDSPNDTNRSRTICHVIIFPTHYILALNC